jgi:hypothetical protein
MTIELLTPIGRAILDSFWWITMAAVGLAVCLWLLHGASPSRRYFVAAAFLLATLGAFGWFLRIDDTAGSARLPAAIADASFDGRDWTLPVAIAWLCGVILFSLRTIGGWVYLRFLIRRATPYAWPTLDDSGPADWRAEGR